MIFTFFFFLFIVNSLSHSCTATNYYYGGSLMCPSRRRTDLETEERRDPGLHTCCPCTAGNYCPDGTNVFPCTAGSYCPILMFEDRDCSTPSTLGYYCPTPTTRLQCVEGSYCNETRQTSVSGVCDPGYFCKSGSKSSQNELCYSGHYCVLGRRYPCPTGTYATEGVNDGLDSCLDCTVDCNGHGSCTTINGCNCDSGWTGSRCESNCGEGCSNEIVPPAIHPLITLITICSLWILFCLIGIGGAGIVIAISSWFVYKGAKKDELNDEINKSEKEMQSQVDEKLTTV